MSPALYRLFGNKSQAANLVQDQQAKTALVCRQMIRQNLFIVVRNEFWIISPYPRQGTPPIASLKIVFSGCRATLSNQQNIISIERFTSQNLAKLPWSFWIETLPQNGQRENFTHRPPCLLCGTFGVPVSMKPLSPLFCFRGLPPTSLMMRTLNLCRDKWS